MGSENNTTIVEDQKPRSVFQGDGSFLKKILARKSFRGNSMRLFYTENPAAVPFDWETQPGTPKHPQSEAIPRIKPPPAMHSRALDKPKFASSPHPHPHPHPHTRVAMSCFTFPRRRSSRKTHIGKKAHDSKADKTPQSDVVSSDVNYEDSKPPSSDHSRTSSSTSSFSTSSSSSSSSLRGLAKELFVKLSF